LGHGSAIGVRTPDEFAGVADTPAESGGGHLPGAVNVPWTSLVSATPPTLPTDKTVVVYCTSGLRSALAWVALTDAGYRAVNYDGSWWEWASLYGIE
jgi:thiosulfate/3-mercaptopyruvate sulfurtransferase